MRKKKKKHIQIENIQKHMQIEIFVNMSEKVKTLDDNAQQDSLQFLRREITEEMMDWQYIISSEITRRIRFEPQNLPQ